MTPRYIRTLIDAKPREFGYTVVEYDLSKGTYCDVEVKSSDTKMRIEQEGQQFEMSQSTGTYWTLIPRNLFMEYFEIFKAARELNNYVGDFISPTF